MTDDETTADLKRQLSEELSTQPLGDGYEVKCGDCGKPIEEGDRAKGYIMGDMRGLQWKLAKVLHPDCGRLFNEDRIGQHDETEGLVEGTIVRDHSVSSGRQAPRTAESGSVAFIEAAPGNHRLKDIEVTTLHIASDEKRQERQAAMEQGKEIMEAIEEGRTSDLPPFWREMLERDEE